MGNQPFFTIGIPVYNTAKWVGDCIESILNQGFEDFEIICVDDGSTDNSLEVLNSYAAKDSRIKVITRENGGVSRARNTIFYYAQGQYIYAIDSDDTMLENVLPRIYDEIKKNDYPDILHTCCVHLINGEWIDSYWLYPGDECFDPSLTKDERAVMLWLNRGYAIFSSSKFIRREFLHKYGLSFSHQYVAFEDSDFSFEVYRKIDKMAYTDIQSFVYYMPREGSASTGFNPRYLKSMLTHWKNFYSEVECWNLSDEIRKKVKDKEIEFYTTYRNVLITAFEGRPKEHAFQTIEIVNEILGSKIRELPADLSKNGILQFLYKLIGIKKTSVLLYRYLKLKKVI